MISVPWLGDLSSGDSALVAPDFKMPKTTCDCTIAGCRQHRHGCCPACPCGSVAFTTLYERLGPRAGVMGRMPAIVFRFTQIGLGRYDCCPAVDYNANCVTGWRPKVGVEGVGHLCSSSAWEQTKHGSLKRCIGLPIPATHARESVSTHRSARPCPVATPDKHASQQAFPADGLTWSGSGTGLSGPALGPSSSTSRWRWRRENNEPYRGSLEAPWTVGRVVLRRGGTQYRPGEGVSTKFLRNEY